MKIKTGSIGWLIRHRPSGGWIGRKTAASSSRNRVVGQRKIILGFYENAQWNFKQVKV
jgi:hypothetical protein